MNKPVQKNLSMTRPVLFVFLLIVIAGLSFAVTAFAQSLFQAHIKIGPYSDEDMFYVVDRSGLDAPVSAIVATYKDGRLVEVFMDSIEPGSTEYVGYKELTEDYDEFKVFVVGEDDFAPKAEAAGFDDLDQNIPNIFSVSSADAAPGEEVTVTVSLTGIVDLCGFDAKLMFDPDELELKDISPNAAYGVTANLVGSGSYIRFNYTSPTEINEAFDIFTAVFTVKASSGNNALLKIEPVMVVAIDPYDPYNFVDVQYNATRALIHVN